MVGKSTKCTRQEVPPSPLIATIQTALLLSSGQVEFSYIYIMSYFVLSKKMIMANIATKNRSLATEQIWVIRIFYK